MDINDEPKNKITTKFTAKGRFCDSLIISPKANNIWERYNVVGIIVMLFLDSPLQQKYHIYHIATRVIPALKRNQYKIYYKNLKPVAFVCWSYLSINTEKKYEIGNYDLNDDEWNGGDRLWFNEFVAPYGDVKKIVVDLRKYFCNKKAKAIRRRSDGSIKSIYHLHIK